MPAKIQRKGKGERAPNVLNQRLKGEEECMAPLPLVQRIKETQPPQASPQPLLAIEERKYKEKRTAQEVVEKRVKPVVICSLVCKQRPFIRAVLPK